MSLFDKYSLLDYGIIASSIIIFQYLIERFRQYGIMLGLQYQHQSPNPILVGYLVKDFCFHYLTLVVLITIIVSIRFSPMKLQNFFKPTFLVLMGLIMVSIVSMIININSPQRFNVLGYQNLHSSFLVYYSIALYLLYLFRNEGFPKAFLLATLGVLTVSHLWELPFNSYYFLTTTNSHIYFLVVNLFSWVIPIFFWFYITKKVYSVFIREHKGVIMSLMFFIAFLTIGEITERYLRNYWLFIGFLLRFAYALLIVFLPFYYYRKSKRL